MLTTPSLSSGAVLGASLGALLSVALLILAMRGGEAAELGMTLAAVLGMPVSLLVTALESLSMSGWLLFITVPLNGALIGAIVGASAHALGWHTRLGFTAIPLLWLGVVALVAWWMRTH
jgi:hypothetical protein